MATSHIVTDILQVPANKVTRQVEFYFYGVKETLEMKLLGPTATMLIIIDHHTYEKVSGIYSTLSNRFTYLVFLFRVSLYI